MDGESYELNWQLLFRAVIAQAAKDAFRYSSSTTRKNKDDALKFLNGGKDLELACDIADVNYNRIIYWMKNISKNNNLNYKRILGEVKK